MSKVWQGTDAERSARLEDLRAKGRSIERCVGCGFEEPADLTGDHHDEDGKFWCVSCWGGERFRRGVEQIKGKTLADITMWEAENDGWNERSSLTLHFADGWTVGVTGWGYDAWGVDLEDPKPPST